MRKLIYFKTQLSNHFSLNHYFIWLHMHFKLKLCWVRLHWTILFVDLYYIQYNNLFSQNKKQKQKIHFGKFTQIWFEVSINNIKRKPQYMNNDNFPKTAGVSWQFKSITLVKSWTFLYKKKEYYLKWVIHEMIHSKQNIEDLLSHIQCWFELSNIKLV